ncbi:CDP-glycerol:poly(glycerophosphate) glycerophosphotransferase [Streptomyces sp. YIM 130001]|uniref:bifunctional glycosyltransferase/CDP-glycerol:glycerophosphate glycerophosphotransferase n=1 Tax=Streptomyces sp. YIM 130001 TaxID=2259644 RepID=UPI000ED68C6B|nr:bifunctional glycosyltransferase/CDP-glycerol:glycerophosphate glycerophosphotransferase [Streptomyces sp. YIM 130001]RII19849.1 CDP-glycerol:poly(glycerophosphate) glycerophosphotransferase [Streptomyces sp. YIM 130001]
MAPRLTVVVPVHNVEDYLDACLRSLADQTLEDLEVVMVDDGSTDGSPDIARRYADEDARFRLVRQENAGLGAARNAGVKLARGTHLAFVDSDDLVPEDAYEKMLASLEESGSDLVSGNVHRLRPNGRTEQSWMFKKAMRGTRSATHVTRDWSLIADRIACNKVFRKDFWDRHGFAFPTGVLFEDVPVVVPAHFLAGSVDVLKDTVYLWRDRDGSITNRRTTPRAIEERTVACGKVRAFLAERAERAKEAGDAEEHANWAEASLRYESSVLRADLWYFLDVLPDGDAAYREAFLQHANAYAGGVDRTVFAGLPLHLRVKWQLVRERRMAELLELLGYEKANPNAFRVRGLRKRRAEFPVLRAPLPAHTVTLSRAEVPLSAQITEAEWRDGRLRLKGYAYRRNLPAGRLTGRLKFIWLRLGRRRIVPLRVRTRYLREATYASKQGLHRYEWAGFETVVDPRRLVTGRRSATWQAETAVYGGAGMQRGPLRMPGGAAPLAVHYPADHVRVVPSLSRGRLQLKVERIAAQLTEHRPEGDAVRISGTLAEPAEGLLLRVENWYTKQGVEVPLRIEGRTFTGLVPLAALGDAADGAEATELSEAAVEIDERTADSGAPEPADSTEQASAEQPEQSAQPDPADPADQSERSAPRESVPWGAYLQRADGSRRCALGARDTVLPGRYPLRPGRELYLTSNASGNLELRDQTVRPIATGVTWSDDGLLTVTGSHPAPRSTQVSLLLRHAGHDEEIALPVSFTEGGFSASVRPAAVEGIAGTLPLAEGRWYLFFRERDEDGTVRTLPMHVSPALYQTLPVQRALNGRQFAVERRSHDRLLIESGSVLSAADRGGRHQRELRRRYQTLRGGPRREAVLYSSFDGRQYSDSPRAVHEELVRRGAQTEHLWVVRDQQAEVPLSARPVVLWSAEWYEALATCRTVVTNSNLPTWFERAEGQTVVQTWHGTPLKRIGRDVSGVAADPGYIAGLPARAAQWSVLVSPNRVSTSVLRRAFGYEGEVMECGYPRNDMLHAPDRQKIAAAVRERLGIAEDKQVILYAPTWRENQPKDGGRYGFDLQLDLAAAERALGDDHVLLVRRHYLVGGTLPDTAFVRDVSRYPDVAELLQVSDVLVTDYSSLMFDFAQTGRPMLFHTYDLDHYRDTLRGFYFDFESKAPGPLIAGQEELLEALADPAEATAGHAGAYDRFRDAYCDLDDGHAAARVADYILGGGRA